MGYLSEAYYGKNMKLLRVEALFEQLGTKMKAKKAFNPNSSDELKEINSILTKMFNFEKLYLVIDGDINSMNAFTIPFFFADKFDKKLLEMEETKEGIRYKVPDDKVLVLNINAYNLLNLTPPQNVSILMHEIGHNFFLQAGNVKAYRSRQAMKDFFERYRKLLKGKKSLSPTAIINLIYFLIMLILMIIRNITERSMDPKELLRAIAEEIRRNYKSKKQSSDEILKTNIFIDKFLGWIPIIKKPFQMFLAPAIIYVKQWEIRFNGSSDYDNEKFADNFATSYGYGKEVAEVFTGALSRYDDEMRKTAYGITVQESMMFGCMLTYFADPHPSNVYRVKWAKKKLEFELERNKKYMTPKQIKDIENQIATIDELLKDDSNNYLKINQELNKKFNYDDKKDQSASKLNDEDIMAFENGLLKEFIKNGDSTKNNIS